VPLPHHDGHASLWPANAEAVRRRNALRAQRVPRARGAARYLLLHVVHARLRLRLPQPVRPVTTKRDHFGHREHRHSYLQGPYEGQAHRHTCFHRSARAGINRFHRTARAGVHGGRTRTPTEARRARTAASSAAPCSKVRQLRRRTPKPQKNSSWPQTRKPFVFSAQIFYFFLTVCFP